MINTKQIATRLGITFLLCYFCGAFFELKFYYADWRETTRLAIILVWAGTCALGGFFAWVVAEAYKEKHKEEK